MGSDMTMSTTLEYARAEAEQYAPIEAGLLISNEVSKRHVKEFLKRYGLWEVVDAPELKPQQLEPLLQSSEFSKLPTEAQGVIWGRYATALSFSGQQEEALKAVDTAIALFKEHPVIWYNRGVLLANLRRYEEAYRAFDHAVRLNPEYSEAWYNRGVALRLLKQYQQALGSFNRALTIRQDYPHAWRGLGGTLGQLKRFAEAVESYKRALAYDPNDYLAWYGLGETLRNLDKVDEALKSYDQALTLNPESFEVWNDRGAVLAEKKENYEEALSSFEHAFVLRQEALVSEPNKTYPAAALVSLFFGISALKRRWLPDLEIATKAFIKWRGRARRDKQLPAFKQAVEDVKQALSEEETQAFEEFMLGVRLTSIRDPFRRWEALGKEISKHWPKDVSAVEAIREQRRW